MAQASQQNTREMMRFMAEYSRRLAPAYEELLTLQREIDALQSEIAELSGRPARGIFSRIVARKAEAAPATRLYGLLLRMLHPDHGGDTDTMQRWFPHIRHAYRRGDSEQLTAIFRQILHGGAPAPCMPGRNGEDASQSAEDETQQWRQLYLIMRRAELRGLDFIGWLREDAEARLRDTMALRRRKRIERNLWLRHRRLHQG